MKQGKISIVDSSAEDSNAHKQGLGPSTIGSLGYPKLKVDFSGWAAIPDNDVAAKKIIEAINLRNKYMMLLDSHYTPVTFSNEAYHRHSRHCCCCCCLSHTRRQRFNSICTCQPRICGEGNGAQAPNKAELRARGAQEKLNGIGSMIQIESDSEDEKKEEEEEEEEEEETEECGDSSTTAATGEKDCKCCICGNKSNSSKKSFGPEVFESNRVKCEIEAFISAIPSGEEFLRDYDLIIGMCSQGPVSNFAAKRLKVLDYKYSFHRLLNSKRESYCMKLLPKDRVSVIKVDTRKLIHYKFM